MYPCLHQVMFLVLSHGKEAEPTYNPIIRLALAGEPGIAERVEGGGADTSPITHIRFLDTFKFMASPLVNLVQNLKEFPCLSEYFLDKDFLTQKGIYPYDYMDSFERFNETQLPSKENFYNKLNNSHISDKDYVHAQNVWEKYNIKNLGEYHDLYLKTDVLLLADVFEAFRKESSYLMYYDANNLYGWAMSQALPYGKLRWVKEKDYKNVLQSDYQRSFDIGESTEKLLTTLYNKKNYVLHQRNLRQYLSKGLRVEKIHRVLKFNQSHWLKGYIDFNTQRRTESKTDFEKDFYKLMNNAVFGKTMENVRKRQNIRLSTSWEQASKLINRPSFTRAEVFTENFCAIHLIKESIEMNKPIYIGTTILDLSKSLMYDYFYNNLRKKYQNDVNLLYMDTDSFILKINTNDVYSDMKRDINIYDTSNYSPESELFSSKNKKVIGKFKDELGGNVMSEFVGLRSKAYAYKYIVNNVEKTDKKLKGVKKNVIKETINFKDYYNCLTTKKEEFRKINGIRSYKHQLYSEEINKKALGAFDDKRFILENGIDSLPYGYISI
uniref:uncharacterized protein n=1 Tax=Myxine glutinosa TaxID=7769 RepID=UPI0035900141